MLYFSNFHSLLSYSALILGSMNFIQLEKLEVIQRKALRIVFKKGIRENIDNLIRQHGILPVKDLVSFNIAKFMYTYDRKSLPTCFNNTWMLNNENGMRNLRNNLNLRPFRATWVSLEKLPLIRFSYFWNKIPAHIRQSSFRQFKKLVRPHLTDLSKLFRNLSQYAL